MACDNCNPLSCVYGSVVFPQRYFLSLMVFFALANAYIMRVSLNLTITEMVVRPVKSNEFARLPEEGEECPDTDDEIEIMGGNYNWTDIEQSNVLSAFFPGYIISHIPGGIVSDIYGGKTVLLVCSAVVATVTMFTPLIITVGDWWLLCISRFLIGLAEGPMFPAVTVLLSEWIPHSELNIIGAFVYSGIHLGNIIGTLFTGLLMACTRSWSIIFYVWGVSGLLWCILFHFLCSNSPYNHKHLSQKEQDLLFSEAGARKKHKIPWKGIILSVPVWVLVIAEFGHSWILFTIGVDLPKYMKEVLKYNIAQNATMTTIPYLVLWICAIFSGWLASAILKRNWLSVNNLRKLFTTIAAVVPGLFCIVASYMGCNRTWASTFFAVSLFFMGPYYAGMKINPLDISNHFAGTVMAIMNGIGGIAGALVPHVVTYFTPNHTFHEWRIVFYIVFAICAFTSLVYIIAASADRQEWDKNVDHTQGQEAATTNA